ncbi:MAG: hypothetical protein ACK5KO_01815 [Arachnia sp.]
MATWTDGAAYAPIERPDGFAAPEVEALPAAPQLAAVTPGAIPPPANFAMAGPAVALEQVNARPVATRDPQLPFAAASALLAPGTRSNEPRDPRVPFQSESVISAPQRFGDAPPPPPGALPVSNSPSWQPPPGAVPNPLAVASPPPGMFAPPGDMYAPPPPARPTVTTAQQTCGWLAIVAAALTLTGPLAWVWYIAVAVLGAVARPILRGGYWVWAIVATFIVPLIEIASRSSPLPAIISAVFIVWSAAAMLRYALRK